MTPLERAAESLAGVAVGDAFGQSFFRADAENLIAAREAPPPPWLYTDDTEMSLSVFASLRRHGAIDQDFLATSFAAHYDYDRAYGPAMHRHLDNIRQGEPWARSARDSFAGQGSFGNGAAMRSALLGAYFAEDLSAVSREAVRAAEVTHAHPEGIAGAVAIALAAAEATLWRARGRSPDHKAFLDAIIDQLTPSEVRSRLIRASAMVKIGSLDYAVSVLGNGTGMSAQDTVPFALWCCAQSLDDYEQALWLAVSALGDRDTICAIVGGVVVCKTGLQGIPEAWRRAREELPAWHLVD